MANAYGSALAYGISQIRGSVAPWRVLFVIEGVPTCLIAIVVWFFLPDSIDGARFLNAHEKQVASHFLARNQTVDVHKKAGIKFKELFQAFKEPQCRSLLSIGKVYLNASSLLTSFLPHSVFASDNVFLVQRLLRLAPSLCPNHHLAARHLFTDSV